MPLDFPSSPTVGQQYLNWTWNGVAWVVTAAQPVPFYNNSGRNFLDNALFNVLQRGTGPWTAQSYTADRWLLSLNLDTTSVSPLFLSDAQRTQIGDEDAIWGLQNTFAGNAGAAAYTQLTQRIENVRRLSGKTITVSFFAQASAPLLIGVSVDQNFGTGGSPSPPVLGNGKAIPISTTFARYQTSFNVPSTVGMTTGTNGDSFSTICFWYSSGTNQAARAAVGVQSGTITLWGVQVEVGSQATPLEKLVPEVDLARCQRFFFGTAGNFFLIYTGGPMQFGTQVNYPVTMRAAPTITFSAYGANNITVPIATGQIGVLGCIFSVDSIAAGPAGWNATFTASADL